MRTLLAALLAALRPICRYGTMISFLVLIGVVTLQVLGRLPGFPLYPWTEEVARFALVYLVAFSCGIAVLRSEMVNVDLVVSLLPAPVRRAVDRVVDVIVLGFALLILPGAWDYVVGSVGERARSIDIPMITVYVVTLIIPAALAVFSILRLFGLSETQPRSDHGEMA